MSQLRELAYQIDPALWVREVLESNPHLAGRIPARTARAPRSSP